MISVPHHQPIILPEKKKQKKTTTTKKTKQCSLVCTRFSALMTGCKIQRWRCDCLAWCKWLIHGVRTWQTQGWREKRKTKEARDHLKIIIPSTKRRKNTTGSYTVANPSTSVVPSLRICTIFYCTLMENVWLSQRLIIVHAIGYSNTAICQEVNISSLEVWSEQVREVAPRWLTGLQCGDFVLFCWSVALSLSMKTNAGCLPRLSYSFLCSVEISIVLSVPVYLQWTREPAKIDVHKISNVSQETTAGGKRKRKNEEAHNRL